MSWRVVAYVFAGLFVVYFVLPKAVMFTAHLIHQYTRHSPHSSTADSGDAEPKGH